MGRYVAVCRRSGGGIFAYPPSVAFKRMGLAMHVVLPILMGIAVAFLVTASEHWAATIVLVVAVFLCIDEIFSAGRDRDAFRERLIGMSTLLGIRVLDGLASMGWAA